MDRFERIANNTKSRVVVQHDQKTSGRCLNFLAISTLAAE